MPTTLSDKTTLKAEKKLPLKLISRVVLTLVVVWVLCISALVVFPPQGDTEGNSDAVVSLAPQEHRLFTALQLVESGHTDSLVISHFAGDFGVNGSGESMQRITVTDYCEEHRDNGVVCFTPVEDGTIGEAFSVRDIAAKESWDNLTVVTSRAHAFRAHYIFEQCVGDDVDVNLVHSNPDLNLAQWAYRIAHENAAFIKALWQTTTRC